MKRTQNNKIIKGIVLVSDWDTHGNPIEIKISSAGEVDYYINPDKKGKRLFKFLQNIVTVEAEVCTKFNKNNIYIKKIIPNLSNHG